jgi:hypothetical protein
MASLMATSGQEMRKFGVFLTLVAAGRGAPGFCIGQLSGSGSLQ